MSRILRSVLLTGVLILLMTSFGCSCTHRGSSVEGPVREAWVARYAGYDGKAAHAYAYDVAVDASGSVYMTGQSHTPATGDDYVTIKYDGSGRELWSAGYDGPGNSWDSATAIAVDALGNVYVAGHLSGGYKPACLIIKYSPEQGTT